MKKSSVITSLGAAALALSVSATASFAGYMQPGETMGVSLLSPLPEGVFFADLEDYGRSNLGGAGAPKVGLGVNIPVIIWSTPISFYNTRLEFIVATPFAHLDGDGLDRFGGITQGYGPLLGHDFGGGLTGGVGALFRTPDVSHNIQDLSGRTAVGADFRQSLQYKVPTGPFGGITLIENAAFTSCFCRNVPITGDGLAVAPQNDMFAGDFTAQKSFGKFTIGFTGYGNIDTNNIARLTAAATNGNTRERNVAVGGLVGYDFGRFTLTGIVTHSLYRNAIVPTVSSGEETRGWVRVIVPLYVAPAPMAPVVAKY
jgi:Putative MetA-pathway of phenol degradation